MQLLAFVAPVKSKKIIEEWHMRFVFDILRALTNPKKMDLQLNLIILPSMRKMNNERNEIGSNDIIKNK